MGKSEVTKTIKVIPFSGRDEDWGMWSRFLSKVRKEKFKDILIGTKVVLPKVESEDRSEEEKLVKKNGNEMTELFLSILDELSFGIMNEAVIDD